MNSLQSIVLIFVLLLNISSCSKQEATPPELPTLQFDNKLKAAQVVESGNAFGIDLFKEVLKMKDVPTNVMISPTSVTLALGMTYNGAEGETREAFEEALRVKGLSREEVNQVNQTLLDYLLKADPTVELGIANSIWSREDFEVLPSFVQVNQDYYKAEVKSLDFSNPSSKDIINDWVANKTRDRIKNILDGIPSDAVMYLINAIYFKGTWTMEFKESETSTGDFHKADGTQSTAQYMTMHAGVDYFSGEDFSMIDLPYGNKRFSMTIVLPNQDRHLDDILENITSSSFQSWVDNLDSTNVDIYLPKFKFDYKTLLNDPLKLMGLSPAFAPGMADFSSINEVEGKNLFISRVIHQSFVEVNEKGTEAAAATVVEIDRTSVGPSNPVFRANRPFLFFIREKASNTILFTGRMGDPS